MATISVDSKILEGKILNIRQVSSAIGQTGDNLATIRYELSDEIRYRQGIDNHLGDLSRQLNDLEQDVYNSANIVDQAIKAYHQVEKSLLESLNELNLESEGTIIMEKVKHYPGHKVNYQERTEQILPTENNEQEELHIFEALKNNIDSIHKKIQDSFQRLKSIFQDIHEDIISSIKHLKDYLQNEKGIVYIRVPDPIIGKPVDLEMKTLIIPSLDGVLSRNVSVYSDDVKCMQQRLNELGYLDANGNKLDEDGYFGDKTLEAVNRFKEDHQLWNHDEYAGKVGQTTWEYLFRNKVEVMETHNDEEPKKHIGNIKVDVDDLLEEAVRNIIGEPKILEVQGYLTLLDFPIGTSGSNKNGVDGKWGNKGKASLKAFQKITGLEVTGVLDDSTKAKMRQYIAEGKTFRDIAIEAYSAGVQLEIEKGSTQADRVNVLYYYAINDEQESKVPAAITVAQGIQESSAGSYIPVDKDSGKYSYNMFGIKANSRWLNQGGDYVTCRTHEYVNDEKIYIDAKFRAYDSFYESVQNHSDFLIVNKRYSKLFEITNDENYLANWAKGLSECGYATDPTYANSLMSHIKNYGLK